MAQAIVNPEEIRRFAARLKQFNNELLNQLTVLHGQLSGLGQSWRDREHDKFVEEFEETMQVMKRFVDSTNQHIPFLMRKADGRVLVWVWREDPALLVAMAQLQEATPQLRTARAMMPMEYDDTEQFRNPHLGVGERLLIPLPRQPKTPPFATYTWDVGTHFVTLTAVCSERSRFGTITAALDDLARSLRVVDDLTLDETTVLRLDPS